MYPWTAEAINISCMNRNTGVFYCFLNNKDNGMHLMSILVFSSIPKFLYIYILAIVLCN